MESLKFTPEFHQFPFMSSLSSKLKPAIYFTSSIDFRAFCASSSSPTLTQTRTLNHPQILVPERTVQRDSSARGRVKASEAQLKDNWLGSLCYPLPEKTHLLNEEEDLNYKNEGFEWVLGIDPDVSGAVALLKTKGSVCSAEVFDSPHVKILVGKRTRRRLDAKSIVRLVRGFDAPIGTTAYIEQSLPYPQDGKQGWWSGGFGYGLWIGILVGSGFSVVPVPSFTWKAKFELSGSRASKDDSRRVASTLFPSLGSLLSRKKDHGRAEALLIAAYGKDHKNNLNSNSSL